MNQSKGCYFRCFFRYGIFILLAVLLCFALLPPISANASDELNPPRKTVRVGYPITPGFSEVDANGNYSGYTYEYLQELAQYTGWEYEFVMLSGSQNEVLTKMYDMLEKGELDLIGATNYSVQLDEIYDYPTSNYGYSYSTLEVLDDNTSINDANYGAFKNIRIAVFQNAKNGIAALNDFCFHNNIQPELIYCNTEDELIMALKENRADALLSNDAAENMETRIISRFNPKPFYLVTTSGNSEILKKLNESMLMLNNSDPYFTVALYQKYFADKADILRFTYEEKEFIRNSPILKVGISDNRLPLEDISEDGKFKGISVDLIKMISENTGLQIEIVPKNSVEELLDSLKTGDIDLALGITYDYTTAQKYNFSMSKPYFSSQVIMATQEISTHSQLKGKRLALPRGVMYNGEFIGEVIWYNSILECLKAVNNGEADYCYGNGNSVEYYCNLYRYSRLLLVPQPSPINQYCIGVSRPTSPLMITILNKVIRNIPQNKLQAIIYENSAPSNEGVTVGDVIEANPIQALVCICIITAAILAILAYFALIQRRAKCKAQIENERYELLAEMSGEYLFEYDVSADCLRLTEKTAQAFDTALIHEHFYSNIINEHNSANDWITDIYEDIKINKSLLVEHQISLVDGQSLWSRITVAGITDSSGHIGYLIGKISDIQAEKLEKDKLFVRAQTDGLTGLYNIAQTRTLIEECLENNTSDSAGTLLVMDIDYFKSINDRFGHYTGDQVLQGVARLLRKVFSEYNIVGRLGGDEFIIFMQGNSNRSIIEDKCSLLQKELEINSLKWQTSVTLSIGAAIAKPKIDYNSLYQEADKALYTVKSLGRNGFHISESDIS